MAQSLDAVVPILVFQGFVLVVSLEFVILLDIAGRLDNLLFLVIIY
jgi:hypothetical protein